MNCSPTIAIALLLLTLTAGAWLLNKTQKESLSGFFRFVAWFVIVASFLGMIHCAVHCAFRCCKRGNECRQMEMECGMGGGMEKRVMMYHGGGGCERGEGKCCKEMEGCEEAKGCEEEKECCKEGEEKSEMKKDTAEKKK